MCSSDDHWLVLSGSCLNLYTLRTAVLFSASCGALEAGSLELSGRQIGPGVSVQSQSFPIGTTARRGTYGLMSTA